MANNKAYAICRKDDPSVIFRTPKGKQFWSTPRNAKLAFRQTVIYKNAASYGIDVNKPFESDFCAFTHVSFDEQDTWEIVELVPDARKLLEEAISLICEAYSSDVISFDLEYRMQKFLDKVGC